MNRSAQLLAVFMLLVIARPASAQMLAGEGLIKALRQGGYVIVMRHASSPREVPTKLTADAGNVKLERQLDEAGRPCAWRSWRILERRLNSVMAAKACKVSQTHRLGGYASASRTFPPDRTRLS